MVTNNSHIIKAIQNHIDTGIPIDSYDLMPQDRQRIEAVFHLYKVWKQNMLIDKRAFLQHVHNRRPQDIAADLFVFDYIKQHTNDMLLSKSDLLIMQQQAVIEGFQAARQNGESATLLKAADKIEKLREAMPEENEQQQQELDDFYTTDIKQIAPDFVPVDSALRRRLLAKYGGKQDENTQMVEDKTAALLEENVLDKVNRILYDEEEKEEQSVVRNMHLNTLEEVERHQPPKVDDMDDFE